MGRQLAGVNAVIHTAAVVSNAVPLDAAWELTPTATWFVDRPEELARDRYGFYGVAWYWTVARPHINSLSDAGDLIGVTKAINGGLHGIADGRNFWAKNKALSANGEWS